MNARCTVMRQRPLASGRTARSSTIQKNSAPHAFLGYLIPSSVSGVGSFPRRPRGPLRRWTQAPNGIIHVFAHFTLEDLNHSTNVCVVLVWPGRKTRTWAPTEGISDRRHHRNPTDLFRTPRSASQRTRDTIQAHCADRQFIDAPNRSELRRCQLGALHRWLSGSTQHTFLKH